MKYLALLIFFSVPLFGQCVVSAEGGTVCTGPLKVMAPSGGSPTGLQEIIPATAQNPCQPGIAAKDGTYALCGSAGAIVVDFGDGKGYISLKGAPGSNGAQGPPGQQGKTGNTGPQGFQGRTGNTGPQGIPGQKGDTGATGPIGPAGVSGQSIAGPIGPMGPQGLPGVVPKTFTCDTAIAGKGGTGVPKFSVTQLVLTNCK